MIDDFDLEEAEKRFSKVQSNGMLLSDNHINILNKYNIDYLKYSSINDLLYEIEELLNDSEYSDADDLEWLSMDLAERNYYQNTNK